MAFDNDDVLDDSDDEDLKNDPVSQMDMQVCQEHITSPCMDAEPRSCRHTLSISSVNVQLITQPSLLVMLGS